jgi:hypothetical protein
MKRDTLLAELNGYSEEFGKILGRFTKTRDGIHIAEGDDNRFRQIAEIGGGGAEDSGGQNKGEG